MSHIIQSITSLPIQKMQLNKKTTVESFQPNALQPQDHFIRFGNKGGQLSQKARSMTERSKNLPISDQNAVKQINETEKTIKGQLPPEQTKRLRHDLSKLRREVVTEGEKRAQRTNFFFGK